MHSAYKMGGLKHHRGSELNQPNEVLVMVHWSKFLATFRIVESAYLKDKIIPAQSLLSRSKYDRKIVFDYESKHHYLVLLKLFAVNDGPVN